MSASARSTAPSLLSLLCAAGLFAGCFEAPEQATGTRECRDMDGYGGVISYEGATLELPTGALNRTTRICIDLESAQPAGYRMATPHYRFEPLGLELNVPAKVSLQLPAGTSGGIGLYGSRTSAGGGFDRLSFAVDATLVQAPVSVLGTAFAGAPDAASACGPETCAGCCDAQGSCQTGGGNDACGSDGASCRGCPQGSVCSGGRCLSTHPSCSPQSCAGCCVLSGGLATCHPGTERNACGEGAEVCESCSGAESCRRRGPGSQGGTCAAEVDAGTGKCGPQSCAGCCMQTDFGPLCLPGISHSNCGSNGGRCQACALPTVCGPASTGTGGACITLPDAGTPCTALNCKGCCTVSPNGAHVCVPGTSPNACGTGGALCESCSGQEICAQAPGMPGGQCFSGSCGPHNCNGCCATTGTGVLCLQGTSSTQCGAGGSLCRSCPGGTLCQMGACL